MKCYKIVSSYAGKLWSAALPEYSDIKAEYKLNEWVKPIKELSDLGYGLFVFKQFSHAKSFLISEIRESLKLFEAEGKGKMPLPIPNFNGTLKSFIRKHFNPDKYLWVFPEGTMMVKSVKLLREIKL